MADVVPDRRLPAAHLDQRGVGRHARNATDPMRRELAMASVAQLAAAPVRRRQTGAGSSSDSVVTLRPSTLEDVPLIIAGRDAALRRFIGEGSVVPRPKYCIIVDGSLVAGAGRSEHRLPRLSRTPQARLCDPSGRAGAGQLRSGTDVGVATLVIHPTTRRRSRSLSGMPSSGSTTWRGVCSGDDRSPRPSEGSRRHDGFSGNIPFDCPQRLLRVCEAEVVALGATHPSVLLELLDDRSAE